IGLRVQDVNPRGSDSRDNQVPALHVRVRGLRTEARAARVPAEVMQFVVAVWKIHLAYQLAVIWGFRLELDDAHGVALSVSVDVEQRDVREALWRGLHRHDRRGIERWVRTHQIHTHLS